QGKGSHSGCSGCKRDVREKKRDDEALQRCRRKTQSAPPPPPHPTYAQAAACPPASFIIPIWLRPPQRNAVGQSGVHEQKPVWRHKNCPPATAQTDPPAPHSSQVVRRKKRAV
ncbi:uncharacterized, partial [Tachysurus ichikawai]